jgi:uroporphyrinogen-III synthase
LLENFQPPKQIQPCKIRQILDTLEKKDQEILLAALSNPEWASKALARELTARGIKISETPIYRHRRKECPC